MQLIDEVKFDEFELCDVSHIMNPGYASHLRREGVIIPVIPSGWRFADDALVWIQRHRVDAKEKS
jgi:hypothetical protein